MNFRALRWAGTTLVCSFPGGTSSLRRRGLILNFPQVEKRAADAKPAATAAGFKKWQCVLCAFFYDEAVGIPDEGIPAGTRWEDVPVDWTCPECGAHKDDFEMMRI